MKATDLYSQLEKVFVKQGITEDWYDDKSLYDESFDEYFCENFKNRSMGLLCDFTDEITKIYTAVFPSERVLTKILDDSITNAMLFLHHPLAWDLSKDPDIAFYQINIKLLKKLRKRRISLFNFHLPLDNYSDYATSKSLADALGIAIERSFAKYCGAMTGVIGTTDCNDVSALSAKYTQVVGHETRLYQYGESKIKNKRVGICAGGGNDTDVVKELVDNGINVLISGLSVKNKYSADAHKLEEQHGVNLLGGTHYSSEKFACIAICEYFKALGLPVEFIPDIPCFDDL